MSNPMIAELSTEEIINANITELYKLANLLKFSEPEIIPIFEKFKTGYNLDFTIKDYIKEGNLIVKKITIIKNDKKYAGRSVKIGYKDYDPFYVTEELDKREKELKYTIIKLINKEERIGRDDNSENGLSLGIGYVLETEEIGILINILELMEMFGYDVKEQKHAVLHGINKKFYIKNYWNGYYLGRKNVTIKKRISKKTKLDLPNKENLTAKDIETACFYKNELDKIHTKYATKTIYVHEFLNEKDSIEETDFEQELDDRRDLAKATIVQILSNRGDLITSSEEEVKNEF